MEKWEEWGGGKEEEDKERIQVCYVHALTLQSDSSLYLLQTSTNQN